MNGFDQNADNDMDNEIPASVVSGGGEEFVGNWSKDDTCYILAKRLATFFPALEICGTLNLREMIWGIQWKKFLSSKTFKRKQSVKVRKILQPDDAVEKKNPFFEGNFKLPA